MEPPVLKTEQNIADYQQQRSLSYQRIAESLGTLLASGKHNDVVLEVGPDKKLIAANRTILAARSPVFAAMFEHDCVENRDSRVVIPDVESDTFQQLLLYIYTGKVEFDDAEQVPDLLQAADKVCITGFRGYCWMGI